MNEFIMYTSATVQGAKNRTLQPPMTFIRPRLFSTSHAKVLFDVNSFLPRA